MVVSNSDSSGEDGTPGPQYHMPQYDIDALSVGLRDMPFAGNPNAIALPTHERMGMYNIVQEQSETLNPRGVVVDGDWYNGPLISVTTEGIIVEEDPRGNLEGSWSEFAITSGHTNMAPWQPALWKGTGIGFHGQYHNRECGAPRPRGLKDVNAMQPWPRCDLTKRMHGTNIFAQDASGDYLSCFVWCQGQRPASFSEDGIFAQVSVLIPHLLQYATDTSHSFVTKSDTLPSRPSGWAMERDTCHQSSSTTVTSAMLRKCVMS